MYDSRHSVELHSWWTLMTAYYNSIDDENTLCLTSELSLDAFSAYTAERTRCLSALSANPTFSEAQRSGLQPQGEIYIRVFVSAVPTDTPADSEGQSLGQMAR